MRTISSIISKHLEELVESSLETLLMSPWGSQHTFDIGQTRELFNGIFTHLIRDLNLASKKRLGNHLTHYALQLYHKKPFLKQDLHTQLLIIGVSRVVLNHFLMNRLALSRDQAFESRFEKLQRVYDFTLINLSHFWGQEYQEIHERDQTLIRELKIVKDGLQRQLNLIYQIIRQSPLGVITCDAQFLVQHWNPTAVRLTGYQPPDIISKSVITLFTPPSQTLLRKRLESPRKWQANLEVYIVRKGGGIFPALLSISRMEGAEPAGMQYLINFQDISERVEFKSSVQRLNQLMALSRLSSAIMHDIRNPLNAIGLNTELMEQALENNREDCLTRIDDLVRATRRQLQQLRINLDHYLTYTHLSHLKMEPVELQSELADLLQELRFEAAQQAIELRFQQTSSTMVIMGDWIQLRRVFVNLITNAIEAIGSSGRIRVTLFIRGRRVFVIVCDNGPGIEPDLGRSLFTPFFTTKKSGVGLGLFISREIILAHHGRISVTSKPGKGARFTISLPLHAANKEITT